MELYDEYIILSKEIKTLEEKQKSIREKIEAQLPEEGYKDERITAFWNTRKTWTYSPNVEKSVNKLKALKKKEEDEGIATAEEKKVLTISVK